MSELQDTVRLHSETVTNYRDHLPKLKRGKPMSTKTKAVRVHPAVWQTALKLSKGDTARLLVRSSTEVSVLNHAGLKHHVFNQK